ncbi:MAG: hypothetical protein LBS97_03185 [Treponema sp.]|jgi:hypothetical protein|nr:hypothetical protein [Treponema sp.]
MKKFVFFCLLVIAAASAAFFAGWVQLALPHGWYGVLDTKTSGLIPQVFQAGQFDWRWERLIPGNAKLSFFSERPYSGTDTISGALPSADTYSAQLENKPDFSYSFTVASTVKIKPDALIPLLEKTGIRAQEELDTALMRKTAGIAQAAVKFVLSRQPDSPLQSIHIAVDADVIRAQINGDASFSDITLESVAIIEAKMPDMELYALAKETYNNYRAQVNAAMRNAAEQQAQNMIKSNASLEHLEKVAELLEKHPTLAELIAKNGAIGDNLLSTMID